LHLETGSETLLIERDLPEELRLKENATGEIVVPDKNASTTEGTKVHGGKAEAAF